MFRAGLGHCIRSCIAHAVRRDAAQGASDTPAHHNDTWGCRAVCSWYVYRATATQASDREAVYARRIGRNSIDWHLYDRASGYWTVATHPK